MEDLFRFMLARPAQRVDADKSTIPLQTSNKLDRALERAKDSNDPANAVKQAAVAHVKSRDALHSVRELAHASALQQLVEGLGQGEDRSPEELEELIAGAFDATPVDVAGRAEFRLDRERLSDTLLTNTILGGETWVTSDEAATLLRAAAIVARAAGGDAELAEEGGLARAMDKPILLPGDLFPLSRLTRTAAPPPVTEEPDDRERLEALRAERDRLLSTYKMLTRITPDQIAGSEVREAGEVPLLAFEPRAGLPPVVTAVAGEMGRGEVLRSDPDPGEIKSQMAGTRLRLKPSVVAALGERERAVLEERNLDLTRIGLATATDRLGVELQALELRLGEMEIPTHLAMTKIGSSFLESSVLDLGPILAGRVGPDTTGLPKTHGSVAPAGIGDLLVVKQALKRYEGRELAHVENVLRGEFKERAHRRARTTEETLTTETETKREEERDQQSTERFELKTEASQIQKEDSSLKIGLAVTGRYGPMVEFKASADFGLNKSREEASKAATSYSKEVTARATERIYERHQEERILKTIEVFEETNKHGIDNKLGPDHVVGQYQWIDKVYEAQVFNYGTRLLFDIMLPEPAAFLLHATDKQPKAGADLAKPLEFTLGPLDITEVNYATYVRRYEVVGVTPPPQPYITLSKAVEGKGTKPQEGTTKTLEIPVPDGYQIIGYGWVQAFNAWPGGSMDVIVVPDISAEAKVGTLALAVRTQNMEAYTVSIEVSCQRTDRFLDEWKLKTHAAILQAYQKQVRDYEEKLAALEIQAAQKFEGRNPLENERLIRTELKKGSISVFTAQHFDLFGAITVSSQGYPQAYLPEAMAEGKYIRFFEQAFEWEQMMYFFYPYFWGRKPNWLKRALIQDTDPLFAEFLKAGSVRVVVPVRKDFEHAVTLFLDTGQIWDGGDLPDISSPLYLSIIEEIRERDKAPGEETPQGKPWDVHLPTTLVILRDDPKLPAWQKNAAGEWVPV